MFEHVLAASRVSSIYCPHRFLGDFAAADMVARRFFGPLTFLPSSITSRTLLAHICKLLLHSLENVLPVCSLCCQALFAEVLGSRHQ